METNSDILSSLLASDVGVNVAAQNAVGVAKANYKQLVALKNVTSYSMQQTLHACPRKFQLMKLTADNAGNIVTDEELETNVDFAFGHSVGAGVATFDETGDRGKAVLSALLAWNADLFAEREVKPGPGRRDPLKSFHHAIWAIFAYEAYTNDNPEVFAGYKTIQSEATIGVDLENGYYYVGHIDSIQQSEDTGRLRVKENKTTVFAVVDPALYANSDQALSYALVVDSIGPSEYDVLYTVYSSTEMRWMHFEFTKSPLSKVQWLQDQAFTASNLDQYSEANYFPKRGASCLNFGRRCEHFETCDFSSDSVFGKRYSDLHSVASFDELEQIEKCDYKFTWSDIVKRQKERLNEV